MKESEWHYYLPANEIVLNLLREQSRLKGIRISQLETENSEQRQIIGRLHDELRRKQDAR